MNKEIVAPDDSLSNESVNPYNEEELTYAEVLAAVIFNDVVEITIPVESIEAVKTGLKNLKSRENAKAKEAGMMVEDSVLEFKVRASDVEDFVVLTIINKRRGIVKSIGGISIPKKQDDDL